MLEELMIASLAVNTLTLSGVALLLHRGGPLTVSLPSFEKKEEKEETYHTLHELERMLESREEALAQAQKRWTKLISDGYVATSYHYQTLVKKLEDEIASIKYRIAERHLQTPDNS